jgi:hypothetical protein
LILENLTDYLYNDSSPSSVISDPVRDPRLVCRKWSIVGRQFLLHEKWQYVAQGAVHLVIDLRKTNLSAERERTLNQSPGIGSLRAVLSLLQKLSLRHKKSVRSG